MKKQMTQMETTVFNAINEAIASQDIYCVHVYGISNHCDLSISQIKGCVGSLVKKFRVYEVEPNEFDTFK
jgi:hypothetical protein